MTTARCVGFSPFSNTLLGLSRPLSFCSTFSRGAFLRDCYWRSSLLSCFFNEGFGKTPSSPAGLVALPAVSPAAASHAANGITRCSRAPVDWLLNQELRYHAKRAETYFLPLLLVPIKGFGKDTSIQLYKVHALPRKWCGVSNFRTITLNPKPLIAIPQGSCSGKIQGLGLALHPEPWDVPPHANNPY